MTEIWRRLRRDRLSIAALAALLLFVIIALGADFIASDLPLALRFAGHTYVMPAWARPAALRAYDNQRLERELAAGAPGWAVMPLCKYGPEQQPEIVKPPPAAPDARHWLGTDDRGRDVFARLVHGTRVSLTVGFGAVAICVLVGVLLGMLGGYYAGWVDVLVSRLIEVGLTFPTFFLILIIMGLLERTSLCAIILAVGLTRWTDVARLTRAEVLRLRELDFVLAARVAGAGAPRIMLRHILPNAFGPVLVHAAFGVANAILVESALSFLDFGVPPPMASWGEVLGQAAEYPDRWWLTLCPGALLFLTVSALNVLGEGLRDAIDPRMRDF